MLKWFVNFKTKCSRWRRLSLLLGLIWRLNNIPKLFMKYLTLSWRRPLSYRNQSIDLQSKSVDWFLYNNGLRHERVKQICYHQMYLIIVYYCYFFFALLPKLCVTLFQNVLLSLMSHNFFISLFYYYFLRQR